MIRYSNVPFQWRDIWQETWKKRRRKSRTHLKEAFFRQKEQGIHLEEGLVCLRNSKKGGQCACHSEWRWGVRKLHGVVLMPSQHSNVKTRACVKRNHLSLAISSASQAKISCFSLEVIIGGWVSSAKENGMYDRLLWIRWAQKLFSALSFYDEMSLWDTHFTSY